MTAKVSVITQRQRNLLNSMIQPIIDEATIGDYDFIVSYSPLLGMHQIGMQRDGQDFTDIDQQFGKAPNLPAIRVSEVKPILDGWLKKYGTLWVASHDPRKTRIYLNLLKRMGFQPEVDKFMGQEVISFQKDNTSGKTSSAWGEPRNFLIYAVHPTLKQPPQTPFKGTLPEVKQKCRELLATLPEEDWVVKAVTDGQVLYSERKN